jgi:HK97 family phage major capsid protein
MSVTDNRTLLQKADMALADLTSGGLLETGQMDRYIRLLIKGSVLLPMSTVTTMANPSEERDKIRFSSRVLKPGEEAVALGVGARSKPELTKVTLNAKLFRAEVRLSDEVLEDQIERGNFQSTIIETMAAAVARDVEYVGINGDLLSADPLLAQFDGLLVQATTNTVAGGGATLSKTILRQMLQTMPDEFSAMAMQYVTNRFARISYRDSIADRATALGDAVLQMQDRTVFMDNPVVAIPEFPNSLGGGTNETNVLLTDPANIIWGFHRRMTMKTQGDAPAGVTSIVVSMRFDVKYQEEKAVVKATAVRGK